MEMEIIKDLNDNNNIIEPFTHGGVVEMQRHCVENVRWLVGWVDYKLVELGMFGC